MHAVHGSLARRAPDSEVDPSREEILDPDSGGRAHQQRQGQPQGQQRQQEENRDGQTAAVRRRSLSRDRETSMSDWHSENEKRYAEEVAAAIAIMGPSLADKTREQLLESTCIWHARCNKARTAQDRLQQQNNELSNLNQELREKLDQAPREKGKKRGKRRIRTAQHALRAITQVTDSILAGEIDPAQARAAVYALQTCLVAFRMTTPGNAGTVPELQAIADDEQG